MRALRVEPVDHLFQQVAPDLGDTGRGVEVGKISLRETEVSVKAVDQNLERVLERVEIPLLLWLFRRAHLRLRLQPELAEIGEQVAENLQLVGVGKTIEREHDRRIKRGHIAMPDVAGDAGEEDVGITALEPAHHRHFRNGITLPEIFAQQERVDARSIAAHDHVLVIVRENLGLDEIARAKQIGYGTGFSDRAQRAFAKAFVIIDVGAL